LSNLLSAASENTLDSLSFAGQGSTAVVFTSFGFHLPNCDNCRYDVSARLLASLRRKVPGENVLCALGTTPHARILENNRIGPTLVPGFGRKDRMQWQLSAKSQMLARTDWKLSKQG
jgi:hypothetical protein